MWRNISRIFRRLRGELQDFRSCLCCGKKVDMSSPSTDDIVSCTGCLGITCVYCLTREVGRLGENWGQNLRCMKCRLLYAPNLYHNGRIRSTSTLVAELRRKTRSQRLLRITQPIAAAEDPGLTCHSCWQKFTDDLGTCTRCRFKLCSECFLGNYAFGILFDRCPGCRRIYDADAIASRLETKHRREGLRI